MLPGTSELTDVLFAVGEVDQGPGRGVETLTVGELRTCARVVAAFDVGAARGEERLGRDGCIRGRRREGGTW